MAYTYRAKTKAHGEKTQGHSSRFIHRHPNPVTQGTLVTRHALTIQVTAHADGRRWHHMENWKAASAVPPSFPHLTKIFASSNDTTALPYPQYGTTAVFPHHIITQEVSRSGWKRSEGVSSERRWLPLFSAPTPCLMSCLASPGPALLVPVSSLASAVGSIPLPTSFQYFSFLASLWYVLVPCIFF